MTAWYGYGFFRRGEPIALAFGPVGAVPGSSPWVTVLFDDFVGEVTSPPRFRPWSVVKSRGTGAALE